MRAFAALLVALGSFGAVAGGIAAHIAPIVPGVIAALSGVLLVVLTFAFVARRKARACRPTRAGPGARPGQRRGRVSRTGACRWLRLRGRPLVERHAQPAGHVGEGVAQRQGDSGEGVPVAAGRVPVDDQHGPAGLGRLADEPES